MTFMQVEGCVRTCIVRVCVCLCLCLCLCAVQTYSIKWSALHIDLPLRARPQVQDQVQSALIAQPWPVTNSAAATAQHVRTP